MGDFLGANPVLGNTGENTGIKININTYTSNLVALAGLNYPTDVRVQGVGTVIESICKIIVRLKHQGEHTGEHKNGMQSKIQTRLKLIYWQENQK